jgi:two-component system sensor histidine kinase SenX3
MFRKQRQAESYAAANSLPKEVLDLLDSIDVEFLVLDAQDRVIANSPQINTTGLVKDGRIIFQPLNNLVKKARRNNENQVDELTLPRNQISRSTILRTVNVIPIGNSGQVSVLIQDESESQRLDATRRDFVSNISHELKTPIGGLSILGEAILEAIDDPEALKNFAARIGTETKRLSKLVQEIINLSRVQDTDPLEGDLLVELNDVINEAIDSTKINADNRKIQIFFQTGPELFVIGDKNQLVTAVRNILDNAVNYSPANTTVSVELRKNDDIAEISIKDQGIGIPESDLSRIFERFYRVDPARSRETGGTGLGLSIVKHIITNHGGEISVWSKPSAGSTFTLQLPLVTSTEKEVIQ